jgi:hypothetical protein
MGFDFFEIISKYSTFDWNKNFKLSLIKDI